MLKVLRTTGIAAAMAVGLVVSTVAQADMETARKALAADDYAGAITSLDEILQQHPDDAEARFLKGLALARSGDTESALDVFEKLTKSQPDMAEAWNNLGVLRARKGELKHARDALQQAVKINPQHGPAQENLGDVYVALARNAYSRAGELETDNDIARAKSRQLGSFIGDSGVIGSQASDGSSDKSSQPPPVPNVTADSGGRIVIDTSTPQTAVNSWAQAWSAQDVDAYLAMYGDDFKPEDAPSRGAWASDRRAHLLAPKSIEVNLSNMKVSQRDDQALVRFDQRYVSNTYSDRERKALLLEQTPEGWKIEQEGKAGEVAFTVAAAPATTPGEQATTTVMAKAPKDTATPGVAETPEAATQPPPSAQSGSAAPAGESGDTAPMQTAGQAAATEPASETPAPKTDGQRRTAVRQVLQGWARAWSAQDVQAYLNAYSDNYEPENGRSLAAWVKDRREHLRRPAHIDVELSNMQISLLGKLHAVVTFDQHYKSNTYEDREHKRIVLQREEGGWRIVKES